MRRGGISLQNNPGYPVLGNYTTCMRATTCIRGGGRRRPAAGGGSLQREETGGDGRMREEVEGRVRWAATGEGVCAPCATFYAVWGVGSEADQFLRPQSCRNQSN